VLTGKSGRRAQSFRWIIAAALVALAAGCLPIAGIVTGTPGTPRPLVGVLGSDGRHDGDERAAGMTVSVVGAAWSLAQPNAGGFNEAYLRQVSDRITALRSAGMQVVLDPGIQYTPTWVFSLPGGTRFVDQYGDHFGGAADSGTNVANAVTNLHVRAALDVYIQHLANAIPAGALYGVRQGGGPLGELRYPIGTYNGHTNCWWAYDASTQASSPAPGWKPGTGTVQQAGAFLSAYNRALVDYGVWLNTRFTNAFHSRNIVMLPGWGERPGIADRVVASRLTVYLDEFNEGLDWSSLLRRLAGTNSMMYTTYLDAPSVKPTSELEDPAHYIAALAQPYGYALGGENTGNGSLAALSLSLQRAKSLGYDLFLWMDERQLLAPQTGQPDLGVLGARAHAMFG
jgi:hypothetical protein